VKVVSETRRVLIRYLLYIICNARTMYDLYDNISKLPAPHEFYQSNKDFWKNQTTEFHVIYYCLADPKYLVNF
jgi:hypothetical protein